jgi:hypothetical protein
VLVRVRRGKDAEILVPRREVAVLQHQPVAATAGRREWTAVTFNDAVHLAGAVTPPSPHNAVPTPAREA